MWEAFSSLTSLDFELIGLGLAVAGGFFSVALLLVRLIYRLGVHNKAQEVQAETLATVATALAKHIEEDDTALGQINEQLSVHGQELAVLKSQQASTNEMVTEMRADIKQIIKVLLR